jgi:hypothetical protein
MRDAGWPNNEHRSWPRITFQVAAVSSLFLLPCSSLAQQHSYPEPTLIRTSSRAPKPPYQHPGTWYEFVLKQFNPNDLDYGRWMEQRRRVFLDASVRNPYFQYGACVTVLLLIAAFLYGKQWTDHRRVLWITAEMMTDLYNHDAYSRRIAREAIHKYNDHIERCNRAIESAKYGLTIPNQESEADRLRSELQRVTEERDSIKRERDLAKDDLAQKEPIQADMSLRLDALAKKSAGHSITNDAESHQHRTGVGVRYLKGSIVLSETMDYLLLRRVLHCTFVTPDQLFQFMKLDYCASSRRACDNRLRRLQAHELLLRHEIPTISRGVVYSISPAGASELICRGEYYSGPMEASRTSNGHVQHALELNDIHLALKRTGELARWTPESDIRSRNELTNIGFVKDYDATVAVRIEGHECQFALEYERTPKARRRYVAIRKRIEAETEFEHFLYVLSNHELLSFLLREFGECRRAVYFGLRSDFLTETLSLRVRSNRSPLSTTFRSLLTGASSRPQRGVSNPAQAPLFVH